MRAALIEDDGIYRVVKIETILKAGITPEVKTVYADRAKTRFWHRDRASSFHQLLVLLWRHN